MQFQNLQYCLRFHGAISMAGDMLADLMNSFVIDEIIDLPIIFLARNHLAYRSLSLELMGVIQLERPRRVRGVFNVHKPVLF